MEMPEQKRMLEADALILELLKLVSQSKSINPVEKQEEGRRMEKVVLPPREIVLRVIDSLKRV
jgi:hypothetical protein